MPTTLGLNSHVLRGVRKVKKWKSADLEKMIRAVLFIINFCTE